MLQKTFKLIGADGKPYESFVKGEWGGHRKTKVFGSMHCPTARRAIAKGGYVENRVFFANQATAEAAGYRPCANCLPELYKQWKEGRAAAASV